MQYCEDTTSVLGRVLALWMTNFGLRTAAPSGLELAQFLPSALRNAEKSIRTCVLTYNLDCDLPTYSTELTRWMVSQLSLHLYEYALLCIADLGKLYLPNFEYRWIRCYSTPGTRQMTCEWVWLVPSVPDPSKLTSMSIPRTIPPDRVIVDAYNELRCRGLDPRLYKSTNLQMLIFDTKLTQGHSYIDIMSKAPGVALWHHIYGYVVDADTRRWIGLVEMRQSAPVP